MSSYYREYAHEYARGRAREYAGSLGLSITAHGVLLVLMMTSFAIIPRQAQQPLQLAIEGTVIDMSEIRRRAEEQERLQQIELDKQRKAEQERQLIAARKQDEQRRQQEATRLAEQKRSEEAEKARQEQARQQQIAEKERLEKERQAAESAREEARIAAAEKKRRQALEAEMKQQLAAEEKRFAARESGLLAQYEAIIRQKVHRNWVMPASVEGDLDCEVHVTQIPGGEVVGVRMGKCNGDAAVVRSIEAAVFRASPLPVPPDPSLFDRNIRFRFRPQ